MTRGNPYLRIEFVSKNFGDFQALKSISLDIYPGEFVCFLGPSGCGKTTLLRAIAGLDIQTSGRILQNGVDISGLPPSQRDFGIVFQSYALFPNLTVAANVGYGLTGGRMSRADMARRVSDLLAMVGLSGQEQKYPAQLSGGQQQRVALARALAMSPGLLLLDEPLSALDARVRQHLRSELKQLQRRINVTTIMVTHDQEEALAIADRIVVMNEGRIEQVGTPMEIYRQPAAAFVADFVGHMNFLAVEIEPGRAIRLGEVVLDIPGAGLVAGQGATLCIRPEDIQVRGIAPEQGNTVMTRIEHMEFLGSFCRAELRLTCGRSLRADFSINAMRDLGLVPGQALRVALPRDRVRLFPQGQGVAHHG
ncbi:putative 2-aminoethylphosphonate ABC transporter ATP-binding protein [Dongia rigui]|uniref:2-aminoethylphosphonate ABC transporter ATP-binding protein n=1 Tax=Dongia rigui TaxID=940149 RepID=A0ABU5E1C0_9PROT|nr:putative 2-aminoethylphosphonate ABC transporter ATP-binding protein [Dongia rigui]MDY0873383.1 putative 2-aminoethylphosphonate ABC transporter ATP-binding protein [Dongia rigui]